MFCPQLVASISTAKLGHGEAATVLCHLATFLNKPSSPASISQEDSRYQPDTWSLQAGRSGKHCCRLALLPNPPRAPTESCQQMGTGLKQLGLPGQRDKSHACCYSTICEMGWAQPVKHICQKHCCSIQPPGMQRCLAKTWQTYHSSN